MAKAFERGADAVILDLEDGAPESAKQMARQVVPALAETATAPTLVRINDRADLLDADLDAISGSNVAAAMAPKVESADIIAHVAAKLSRGGRSVGIVALIETPLAVEQLGDIAAAPGLSALALGGEDLAAALGAPPNPKILICLAGCLRFRQPHVGWPLSGRQPRFQALINRRISSKRADVGV